LSRKDELEMTFGEHNRKVHEDSCTLEKLVDKQKKSRKSNCGSSKSSNKGDDSSKHTSEDLNLMTKKASEIVKKWTENISEEDVIDFIRYKANDGRIQNIKFNQTEKAIDQAVEFLEKMELLDEPDILNIKNEDSLQIDNEEEVSKAEISELSKLEDRMEYLTGVWETLKQLNKEDQLPSFLRRKNFICQANMEQLEKNLEKASSDTSITVGKFHHYKLKMRLIVTEGETNNYCTTFRILDKNA